jgi:hypothetical protein
MLTYLIITLTDYELIMSIYYYLPSELDRLKYALGICPGQICPRHSNIAKEVLRYLRSMTYLQGLDSIRNHVTFLSHSTKSVIHSRKCIRSSDHWNLLQRTLKSRSANIGSRIAQCPISPDLLEGKKTETKSCTRIMLSIS